MLKVTPYRLRLPSKAVRGSPSCPAGTKVYAIEYGNGRFFRYAYLDRKMAENVCDLMKGRSTTLLEHHAAPVVVSQAHPPEQKTMKKVLAS